MYIRDGSGNADSAQVSTKVVELDMPVSDRWADSLASHSVTNDYRRSLVPNV